MTFNQPSRASDPEGSFRRRFERATRFLAVAVGFLIVGYSVWLLTVGISVQVESVVESANGGSAADRAVVRQPISGAFIPLLLAALCSYGMLREIRSWAWFGALGVFVYGTLSIFGMGLHMPILGLALVMTVSLHAVAERTSSSET